MGGDSVFFNTSFAGKGEKGSHLPPIPREARTEWKRGSFVEVAWGVRYNHGGGYQYRLCPADQDLTEECFQKMPLEFDRMRQALRWNDGKTTYALKEQAIFVDGVNVTYPPGSTWASKLGLANEDSCPGPTTRAAGSPPGCLAFDAPCPWDQYKTRGLLPCNQSEGTRLRNNAHGRSLRCDGDGMSECSSDWVVGVISDHVYIPSDIPAGDYVLGWRWDAEESTRAGMVKLRRRDCSERLCPAAPAWVDVASGTDTAHARTECSNMGLCNRETGKCQCRKGFTGAACERMECPGQHYDCNGHGRCVSLAQAAETEDLTYSLWDADRIMGCICNDHWTGYDCSLRTCPRGDDPLTTGQVDEVQDVTCDGASGSFALKFRSHYTGSINAATAIPSDVQAALEAIPSLHRVSVAHPTASGRGASDLVCAGGGRTFEVTFLTEHGDVPLIRGTSVDGVSISSTEQTMGTKEDALCNNRGFCIQDPSSHWSGQCRCLDYRIIKFESSDGTGEVSGDMGDCGKRTADFDSRCPVSEDPYDETNFCSGHGVCDETTTFTCDCYEGWTGHNCEQRTCPYDTAWFSVASATDTAHVRMECSNRGVCDRKTGTCKCSENFEGKACERLACPVGKMNNAVCSSYGICATTAEIANLRTVNGERSPVEYGSIANVEATWDAHKMQGCICNTRVHSYAFPARGTVPTWGGYDCSVRGCPTGPRPTTNPNTCDGSFEQVEITCTSDVTTQVRLTFRDQTSNSFSSDAPSDGVGSLQVHLESLLTIGRVNVTYTTGISTLCTTDGSNVATVTFLTELGDLPDLTLSHAASDGASVSIVTSESVKGSKEAFECSEMGKCDRTTGLCNCFAGFTSGDADGGRGTRGDCSFHDALA
eukprot:g1904.t1